MSNNEKFKVAIFLATGYEMGEVIITIDLLRRANIIIDLVSIENDFGDPLTTEDLKEHDTHVKLTLTDEGKNHFIGENNDLKVNWVPEV